MEEYALRRGREKAFKVLDDLIAMKGRVLRVESQDIYLRQALEVALALKCKTSIYDTLFVAQALAKGAVLVTSNARQKDVASKLDVEVVFV
jgi:predicted nucleic acid-binding protein